MLTKFRRSIRGGAEYSPTRNLCPATRRVSLLHEWAVNAGFMIGSCTGAQSPVMVSGKNRCDDRPPQAVAASK